MKPYLHLAVLSVVLSLGSVATQAQWQRNDKGGSGSLIGGAAGLPDLERGKQAAEAGRNEDAERDLLPLAERGYVDAQLALARLYARAQTPQQADQAIRWYREALPKAPLAAEVPLARLLLHRDDVAQLKDSERLLEHAWSERDDADALAGLIDLYVDHPEFDTQKRVAGLVASAEALDQPNGNTAVIRWYRRTPDMQGHADRLIALCRKALDLVPECYVDLVRDARAKSDKPGLQRLSAAAMSQFGHDRVPVATLANLARALVITPDNAEPEGPPVVVSDVPEADPADLAPIASATGVPSPAIHEKTCALDPVGVITPPSAPLPGEKPASAPPPPKPAPEPPPIAANAEPDLANEIIKKLAAASVEGGVEAAGVLVRFPFLAQNFEIEPALQAGLKQNIPNAALYLGELYMYGQRATRNPRQSLHYLQQATQTPDTALEAGYFIGRLYQYGYLDEVDPPRARAHLLSAARQGYVPADSALARLYASAKGICANYVYAYAFAQLGARSGTGAILTLRDQLRAAMSSEQKQAAERLLKQELAIRAAQPQTGLAQADTETR